MGRKKDEQEVAVTFGHASQDDRQVRRGVAVGLTIPEVIEELDKLSKGGDVEIIDPQVSDL